jgi:hypothetical protein
VAGLQTGAFDFLCHILSSTRRGGGFVYPELRRAPPVSAFLRQAGAMKCALRETPFKNSHAQIPRQLSYPNPRMEFLPVRLEFAPSNQVRAPAETSR